MLILVVIVLIGVFALGFGYKKSALPNHYYKVYMDGKVLGVIKSKEKLENYIDENGSYYKRKYKVNKIYAPAGLQIKEFVTYDNNVDRVSEIYNKIKKKSNFAVKGYVMTVNKKSDDKIKKVKIYVLKKKIFKDAVTGLINTYVGKDNYNSYVNDTQSEIDTTGEIIKNVYLDENITVKEVKVKVDEKIYTDSTDLSKYLLYGDDYKQSDYTVKAGDTIESVAFANKINAAELLLSNDSLTGENNLLYPGQKLVIAQTNPLLSVVEESYSVSDTVSKYQTEEKYDSNTVIGTDKVIQDGENGLDRVSQDVKKVNGEIVYVNLKSKDVLKTPVNKVVLKGSKYVPDVGSLTSWGWPTDSGWTMSSGYGYRSLWGSRELHTGLDIAGTGYGSKIYATNNGKVMIAEYHYSYGNHVVINHNNGYMTVYAHMSKIAAKVGQTVARGDVIGYVGCTGSCTGPHVHYEVWKGSKWNHINPSVLYPNGYR